MYEINEGRLKGSYMGQEDIGRIVIKIEDMLKKKDISKNSVCYDLRIQRGQFNKYCRGDIQRLDVNLLCRLCNYLECKLSDLVDYIPPDKT